MIQPEDNMEEAEKKEFVLKLMEQAKAGDRGAQAWLIEMDHGEEAAELYLRALDGDEEASIRFLSRYSEKHRMSDVEVDRFLDYTDRAQDGDMDAIREALEFAGVPNTEAALNRVRNGTSFLYLILMHSLDSDDPMQRTIARRCLESHGWDQRAYAEVRDVRDAD